MKVTKRNKTIEDFDIEKIARAINKAGMGIDDARMIAKNVSDLFIEDTNVAVDDIHDAVEAELVSMNQTDVVKQYIIYRAKHKKIRKIVDDTNNKLIQTYLDSSNWDVKDNANSTYSLAGLHNYVTTETSRRYWFNKIYSKTAAKAHESGDLYISDLGMLSNYCAGHDLTDLLTVGFRGSPGKNNSKPAKHFSTALNQMVNFIFALSGEAAGAQAFSNVDTLLAPYIYYDNLSYDMVKQLMQELIFSLNVATRSNAQCPFSNFTLDLICPSHMKELAVVVGGEMKDKSYGEFQDQMDMFNRAFCEVMSEGDADGRVMTFPIPTYNITAEFDFDDPRFEPLWAMTAKYGIPYFANMVSGDIKPEDIRSLCCRYRCEITKLSYKGGGLFGAGSLTGCYDDQTEVLTDEGWKLFKDLNKTEKVLTLDPVSREASWNTPTEYFEYDWSGDLVHFKDNSGLDLKVTPNHRQPVVTKNGVVKFVNAEDVIDGHSIPKRCFTNTNVGLSEDEMKLYRFMMIFVGDGSLRNRKNSTEVKVSAKKSRKLESFKPILEASGYVFRVDKDGFITYSKSLEQLLQSSCYITGAAKYTAHYKCLPKYVFEKATTEQCRILLEDLISTDGSVHKTTGQLTYYTVSKHLADDVQTLAQLAGMSATVTARPPRESIIRDRVIPAKNPQYAVYINKTKYFRIRGSNIKKVPYTGKVYCLTVKNHVFYVRRNGRAIWSGNSVGVVTLNLPRLGYLSKDQKDFYKRLDKLLEIAYDTLEKKREFIEEQTEYGLYPYTKYYLRNIKARTGKYWINHFSTIGIIGANECCLNMFGEDITAPASREFILEVMDYLRDKLITFQERSGSNWNLEATPAESVTSRLARIDSTTFKDCHYQGTPENPYYTNSTALPVNFTEDLFEYLDHQDEFQTKYTGGTVAHLFLGEQIPPESAKELVRKVCYNYKLPYISLTPTFSVCPEHGYIAGEHAECPTCNAKTEVYSRIVGYLRPINNWNASKEQEFKDRKTFRV